MLPETLIQQVDSLAYEDLLELKGHVRELILKERDMTIPGYNYGVLRDGLISRFGLERAMLLKSWKKVSDKKKSEFKEHWFDACYSLETIGVDKEHVQKLLHKLVREDRKIETCEFKALIKSLNSCITTFDEFFPTYRQNHWMPQFNEFIKNKNSMYLER